MYDEFSDTQSITDYDLAGRVVGSTLTNENGQNILASANIDYHDKKGTVEGQQVTLYDDANGAYRTIEYEYTYGDITQGENPAALYEMLAGGRTFTYEYDGFGRLVKKALSVGSGADETYTYKANGDNTTTLVETHKDMNGVTHTYTYDGNGNITQEIFGSVTRTYKYDKYNRLERYDDSGIGASYYYDYDERGNIKSSSKYVYTNSELALPSTPIETKTYAYGYDIWADALTNFNGSSITYDYAMNPTSWTKGRTLSWENEKSLASITDGTNTSTYTYNGDRLRTKKVTGSKTTEYYILDGTYVGEKTTVNGNTYRISYVYDENGAPTGLNINGSACYFVKNLQGDVIALMGSDGGVFATYSYDAWGKIVSIKDVYGAEVTNPGNYALLNPFRYRGYMYDDETGFYYLRARYYDPEVGRFLNADEPDVLSTSYHNPNQYNLFAYCNNNHVNDFDDDGNLSWLAKVAIGTAVIAAVGILTVATAGTGTALACFAVGALKGAALGAAMGAASGAATGAVTHRLSTGSWEGSGQAALEGAADGYMMGAITGAISGGLSSNACFVAGTSIATAAGKVAIENIEAGDWVFATDPETGATALKKVVQTFENETTELVHLSVNGEKITTTPTHPFWVPKKGWTAAINLRAGDMLQLLNGEYVVLEAVQHEILESPIAVYNFEVEDFHTYYVAGSEILVHNMCKGLKAGKPSKPNGAKMIRRDTAKVKSQEFKDFIRSSGKSFKSSEWKYRMETWITDAGEYIERHYWYNKVTGESYYHL